MSSKLDQSLGDLVKSRRQSARRSNRHRSGPASKATTSAAPVGGVRKTTKTTKPTSKGATTSQTAIATDSKIIVSGLPPDVNEANIKEYFSKSAGPVKKVMVTYNQNGTSRGIAQITFTKPETAAKAAKELNGLLVDQRPMKIEVVLDATRAPQVPAAKPLTERVAQSKAQPRPATAAKASAATTGGRRGRGRVRRTRGGAGGGNRPKPKTLEQLDAEMIDYWKDENTPATDGAAATNSAVQPQANGEDMGMAEIS